MGNKLCFLDVVVFGLVVVFFWNVLYSLQVKLIRLQLKNLEVYCYVIKEDYFLDWDYLIFKYKQFF